ncbi:MAG: S41 family peptidase [Bacteroidota bacterium]
MTKQKIKGERRPGVPLIILINKHTFSAAEGFAYQLKSLKRAIVIGEQSKGGAHPKRNFNINDSFYLSLPILRNENAITNTDWEGAGVIPDLKVKSESSLEMGISTANELITTHNKQ